jgi:hypothetical protein
MGREAKLEQSALGSRINYCSACVVSTAPSVLPLPRRLTHNESTTIATKTSRLPTPAPTPIPTLALVDSPDDPPDGAPNDPFDDGAGSPVSLAPGLAVAANAELAARAIA